jgi:excisionase family DNA binding protein
MPRTKKKPEPAPKSVAAPSEANGPASEVLTLEEAAAYLRFAEADILRLIEDQGLPGRQMGREWRFLKAALQEWLSKPPPKYSKEAQLAAAGAFKDDPDLLAIVEDVYRQRGRPITEDGSYNLLHGLKAGSGGK